MTALWSKEMSTLEVIAEEPEEMEKTKKAEGQNEDEKMMDGNNTEGNENEDGSKIYGNHKDENYKPSSSTEEEEEEEEEDEKIAYENKDEQNRRKEIEKRKNRDCRNGESERPPPCVTFPEGGEPVQNYNQIEPSDENNIGREVLIAEEEVDGAGEPLWKKWKNAFSWNDFFYAIIFGLGPTSWDVLSDLRFGWGLARSGDLSSAGLCYLFITIPGVFFLQEVMMLHVFKDCSSKVITMVHFATGFLATTAMAFGFWAEPLIFQWPATILGCSIIGVKVAGVFVHTAEMKAFSVRISAFEYTTESNLQLCLLFYLWP